MGAACPFNVLLPLCVLAVRAVRACLPRGPAQQQPGGGRPAPPPAHDGRRDCGHRAVAAALLLRGRAQVSHAERGAWRVFECVGLCCQELQVGGCHARRLTGLRPLADLSGCPCDRCCRAEGMQVFFRGLGVALVRAFPLHAIIFLGYETTMATLHRDLTPALPLEA